MATKVDFARRSGSSRMVLMMVTSLLICACGPATPSTSTTVVQAPTSGSDRIAFVIPMSGPSMMAVGGEFLWVVNGRSIVRIDPQKNQVAGESLSAGIPVEDIAFYDGSLWATTVAEGDLNVSNDLDAVSEIDPQSGIILGSIKVERGPMSLAVTPEGVWTVNFGGNGDTIVHIDPHSYQILGDAIETGRAPLSLAVGDGSIWVANHDAHSVTRIDPASHQVLANISVPSEPHRIAYGEGAVWTANWHVNSITRIDPQTNQVVGEPIPIGFHAGNIVAGLGSVWVTSDYRTEGDEIDVVLVRIDARTNQVVETIPVGGHPIDVALTDQAVWVSVQRPGMVVRINP